jgi:aryl-alcohol dehydrogenase-like predicted oxidoreductase
MMSATLDTCRFGRTDWQVARLSLGTFQLTSDKGVPRDEAVAVIRRAIDAGVNLVDTAPLYGAGDAEALVGEALLGREDRFYLMNKVGRFETGPLRSLGDAAYRDAGAIRRQIEHSLASLRRDAVDMILLHESDWPQWWAGGPIANAPVLDALRELKREGRVRRIGLSARNIAAASKLASTQLFDAMLFVHYFNAVWQENGAALAELASKFDLGIAVGTPFKQGVLITPDEGDARRLLDKGKGDASPAMWNRILGFRRLASRNEFDYGELALRYLLSHPFVHTVTVGPRSMGELEQNLEWLKRGPLPSDMLRQVEVLRNEHPVEMVAAVAPF